jgi:hypothetical protein
MTAKIRAKVELDPGRLAKAGRSHLVDLSRFRYDQRTNHNRRHW